MQNRDSAVIVFLVLGLQAGAAAQSNPGRDNDYPVRPIRMLVGVPPGGSTDLVARIVGTEFLKTFGQRSSSTIGPALHIPSLLRSWRNRRRMDTPFK